MRLMKYFIFIVDKKFIIRKMHLVVKHNTSNAGIAQLVEHDLAKVGVASSSLVSRSIFHILWRVSKAVMHWIANPCSSVRLRDTPPLFKLTEYLKSLKLYINQ